MYSLDQIDFMLSEDMKDDLRKYQLGIRKFVHDDYTQKTQWSDGVFTYMMNAFEKKMQEYERTLPPDQIRKSKKDELNSGDIKAENINFNHKIEIDKSKDEDEIR